MEDQILAILESIKEIFKGRNPLQSLVQRDRSQKEYYPNYNTYVDWRKSISLHTTKGIQPDKILASKHPNMSNEEFQYSKDNFKQVTLPLFYDYLATLGRGVQDNNWSIAYAKQPSSIEASGETFQKYVEETIALTPMNMNLESWFRFVLPSLRTNDSMGCTAIKPHHIPTATLEDGTEVVAGDRFIDPYVHYYKVDDLIAYDENEWYLFLTKYKSEIEYSGKKQRVGSVFEFYDKTAIYRVTQVGKAVDFTFEISEYYRHDLGECPVSRLKGTPVIIEDEPAWQSPYLTIVDILDDALLDSIQLRSIKASTCYPQRVMVGDRCTNKELVGETYQYCEGGFILNEDGLGFHKCSSCLGTGIKVKLGPNNTILIEAKGDIMEPNSRPIVSPSEAMSFHGPSTDTPQFMAEEFQREMLEARLILHLKTTNSIVKGAENMTATSSTFDERAKYAFIKSIIDGNFDIYEWCNRIIGKMRYGNEFVSPIVERPLNYDFNTDSDYLEIISMAIKAGAPPALVQAFSYRYIKAVFYNDLHSSKAYELLVNADRLLVLTQEDINLKLSRNLIAHWEVVLHDSAMNFIMDLVREDKDFLDKDLDFKITAMQDKAKAATPNQPTSKLSTTNILLNANAAPAN